MTGCLEMRQSDLLVDDDTCSRVLTSHHQSQHNEGGTYRYRKEAGHVCSDLIHPLVSFEKLRISAKQSWFMGALLPVESGSPFK